MQANTAAWALVMHCQPSHSHCILPGPPLTTLPPSPFPPQLNMPEDEVAETIRSFRKTHLSELQALAQMRCMGWVACMALLWARERSRDLASCAGLQGAMQRVSVA